MTGLQVLSNPGIATCRNGMEGMNSTGSGDGSGDDSEPMADRNVTCVICGKSFSKIDSFYYLDIYLPILYPHYRAEQHSITICVHICCGCHHFCSDPFVHGGMSALL